MVRRILAAAVVVLPACSGGPTTCTLADAPSVVTAEGNVSVVVTELCVDDVCQAGEEVGETRIRVSDEGRTYGYRISAEIDGQRSVLTGQIETREFWVNGRACGPMRAQAHMLVSRSGMVTVNYPFSDR